MWKSKKEVCVGRLWGKQNKRFYQVKNQSSFAPLSTAMI